MAAKAVLERFLFYSHCVDALLSTCVCMLEHGPILQKAEWTQLQIFHLT